MEGLKVIKILIHRRDRNNFERICPFPDGNAISFEKTQLDSLPPNPKLYLFNFGSPSF